MSRAKHILFAIFISLSFTMLNPTNSQAFIMKHQQAIKAISIDLFLVRIEGEQILKLVKLIDKQPKPANIFTKFFAKIKGKMKKVKSIVAKIVKIIGDPLAILEGEIFKGTGTMELTTEGIPELLPSSTINLKLLEGTIRTGITLPGDQLSGPDGNDTFIEYTTKWESYDPIGTSDDGFPLALGEFYLNSYGRPSEFSYSLDMATGIGSASFTMGEAMVLGDQTFYGSVTKNMDIQAIPEPCSLTLIGTGLLGFTFRHCRKGKANQP